MSEQIVTAGRGSGRRVGGASIVASAVLAVLFAALPACSTAESVAPRSLARARTAPVELDAGLTLRVYRVDEELHELPTLVPEQTPNLDRLCAVVDLAGEDFGDLPAPIVTELSGYLYVGAPGGYRFRLTSDDGSRLWLGDALLVDNDGRHGAESVTSEPVELLSGRHALRIDHFDHVGARVLRLEWNRPTDPADAFSLVPSSALSSPPDLTRVTSPGFKRIEGARRPGDGRPLAGVHPGWVVDDLRPPGFEPRVGALAFLPDGRLAVGTFSPLQRDEVALPDIESKVPDVLWALDVVGATGPDDVGVAPLADGLLEPSGMCVVDGELYVAQRREITRLRDLDGDGFLETHETVASGWEGWNYHQFTFGLVERDGLLYSALSTAMAPPGWEGMGTNAGPNGPMRGGLLEVDPSSGDARVIAGGFRTPNGLGLGPDGALVYLDNQGTWMPTSQLAEIVPGRFYGHANRTNLVPMLADRFPDGGHPSVYVDRPRSPAAVFMPQNEVSNSPTQPVLIESGPFAGQMLVGELTGGGVRRVFLERVDGRLQGTLFRFTQGIEAGVNRMAWGPDGHLYVGCIGAGGNWNWRGTQVGLQRLRATGAEAFEMLRVRTLPDGLRVEFTAPVDPTWLADPSHFELSQWRYEPTAEYGGPKVGTERLTVQRATPSPDGRAVELTLAGLRENSCVHLRTDPVSVGGEPIWSPEAWTTLVRIPRREVASPPTLAGPTDGVGLGALPPAGAVALVATGVPSSMRYDGADPRALPALYQDELLAAQPFVKVGFGTGDLLSATEFGDARLHVEWLSPPGGAGQRAGNSGVYLQDRYEVQVLGTAAPVGGASVAPEANEAGAIYNIKAADVNVSTGPGTWQAYDIWFTGPRFAGDRKIADARVTVYWNGVRVHDDVAIPEPTGARREQGEAPLGPLRLQDHGSDAEGPVRYRNVWVAPLKPAEFAAGPWIELFDDDAIADRFVVRGGDAVFTLRDGVLTGETRPDTPNTFFTSVEEFGDFELIYEGRTHPELNSGVQVRSEVVGGFDARAGGLRGYQVEFDPGERAWSAGIYDERRRGWLHPLHAAPYARRAFRPGDWNRFRVLAQGPVIRTWINGVPAAEIFDAVSPRGHIAFQVHGVGSRTDPLAVQFRNARLRRLTPSDG